MRTNRIPNRPEESTTQWSRNQPHDLLKLLLIASTITAVALPVRAQTTPSEPAPATTEDLGDVLNLEAMVITATTRPGQTKMESSISVTSLNLSQLEVSAPRSTPEMLRSLPGLRAESSSGEGNTNMTVRGLPLSAGGSKYLLIEEDGLPVLEFGDINFGTSEQWLRTDANLANIEFVRGGGAATGASNSPGGVLNFTSKTGEIAGGSLQLSKGVDGLDQERVDLGYGAPIGKDMNFFLGGFYRTGEGFKTPDFTANDGGQIKLNVTKHFENGYIRVYLKALDDRTATFMPVPVMFSGSASNPSYTSLPGFDFLRGTLNTPQLTAYKTVTSEGTFTGDVTDGLHTITQSVGAEAHFDLPGGIGLTDRFRTAKNSGAFFAPYPASVASAATQVTTIGGAGATAKYATGQFVGQGVDLAHVGGNGLLVDDHLFYTRINGQNDTNNDLKLNKPFDFPGNVKIDLDLGLYRARQTINQDWLWNSYLQTAQGKNSSLIDVYDALGNKLTNGGMISYGVGADPIANWGAGNNKRVALVYDIEAPYASVGAKIQSLSLDASVRRDLGKARGSITSATGYVGGIPNFGSIQPYDYNWNATSWSFGANYEVTRDLALFGRVSNGHRANADRFSTLNANGSVPSPLNPVDEVKSDELGVKYRVKNLIPGQLQFFATFFKTKTSDQNFDLTHPELGVTGNHYKAQGLELEAGYDYQGFNIRTNITYTDAKIESSNTPAWVGNRPQRQSKWIYTASPSYTVKGFTFGGALIGISDSYADNTAGLVMPGYAYVNLFLGYQVTKAIRLSVSVNNVADKVGITEVDSNPAIIAGNVSGPGTARSISGRNAVLNLSYTF